MSSPPRPKEVEQDHETRLQLVEKDIGELKGGMGRIEKMLNDSATTQKGDRRYSWNISLIVAGLVMAPLGIFLGLYISSKISPMAKELTSMTSALSGITQSVNENSAAVTTLTASSAASVKEREALLRVQEDCVARLAILEREASSEKAIRRASWVEQETQIHALSESTNSAIAELHRWNFQASQKIPDMPAYPSGPFVFPNISNRRIPQE